MTRHPCEGNVWKSYVYGFLMELRTSMPIWVLYLRDERGFSLTQITMLEVPLFLLIVFAEVPTGAVADRFGRRFSLMLASAIGAAGMVVYGIATSYAVILAANLAWGLAFTFRSGADSALLYDSLEEAGREADFQRLNGRFWALRASAMLAGLLLGAPIAAATSFTFAITVEAIVQVAALLVAFLMHEPRGARERAHASFLRTLAAGARASWQRPALRYIFLFSGIATAGAVAPLLLFQQPWLDAHGVRTVDLGLWQAPVHAMEIVGALSAAWLLSRLGERLAFSLLPLALFLCGAGLGAIDRLWIAVAFAGMALARGLLHPLLATYVNQRLDSAHRATALSVQSLVGNLVLAIAWPLGGMVADAFGLRAVFATLAAATLVLGGAALIGWSRADGSEAAAP